MGAYIDHVGTDNRSGDVIVTLPSNAAISTGEMRIVVEAKDRIIFKNRDRQKAPSAEKIPDLMTAAKLRDAEASNLEHLLANPGETGGRGKVTGRDRMRGQRDGMDLVDSLGDSAEGLLGGGGNPGIADPLDIINFLSEFGGPQKVVFCLDVSASMSVPGLGRQKMELATSSIKDAMLALDDDDHFNIITFYFSHYFSHT